MKQEPQKEEIQCFIELVSGAGLSRKGQHFPGWSNINGYSDFTDAEYPGAHHNHNYNDYYVNSISGVEAHTHTFTGNYTNSSPQSINIQNPYTAVYMYKRTA